MKGAHLPVTVPVTATFRTGQFPPPIHHYHHQQQQQQQQQQHPQHGEHHLEKVHPSQHFEGKWLPIYSVVMLAIVMGIVVPLSSFVSPVAGLVLGLIAVVIGMVLVYRFVWAVRIATMTDWEYVRMPGTLVCLDIYLFVCLNWALVWFVLWATDKEGALLFQPSAFLQQQQLPNEHLVYLIILYNVLASFWFSGGGRLYPASPAAYVWGFLSLVIGAWLAFLVVGWLVHIVRRSPSRVNENTLLPVYHTPVPNTVSQASSASNATLALAASAQVQSRVGQTVTHAQTPLLPDKRPSLQEQEEVRRTFARLAQLQKEQRLREEAEKLQLLQQQQQKSTKAKDI